MKEKSQTNLIAPAAASNAAKPGRACKHMERERVGDRNVRFHSQIAAAVFFAPVRSRTEATF
jgi:hypothetical protein